jgi:hypothetical protein
VTCTPFRTDKAAVGIMCTGRGRRSKPKLCEVCGRHVATLECDGKRPGKQSGTCDRLLCEGCTVRGPDQVLCHFKGEAVVDTTDYCPDCWRAHQRKVAQAVLDFTNDGK